MIICTSVSPNHINKDIQHKAVSSWLNLGMKVYSFNCRSEIAILKNEYPEIEFVETKRTMELTYNKPLVSINAVLDWCKEQKEQEFCLINSDIEINTDIATIERIREEMSKSIVLVNRVDYSIDYVFSSHQYLAGIDIFFIHKKWMTFYPQSMHCFGMTFWDYFIPYVAIKSGINVVFVQQNIAFHKAHAAQYNHDDWMKSGRFFLWENNLYQFDDTRGVPAMSTFVYNFIYNASQRKQI